MNGVWLWFLTNLTLHRNSPKLTMINWSLLYKKVVIQELSLISLLTWPLHFCFDSTGAFNRNQTWKYSLLCLEYGLLEINESQSAKGEVLYSCSSTAVLQTWAWIWLSTSPRLCIDQYAEITCSIMHRTMFFACFHIAIAAVKQYTIWHLIMWIKTYRL